MEWWGNLDKMIRARERRKGKGVCPVWSLSRASVWGKVFWGRGNSVCKGPGMSAYLHSSQSEEEATMAEAWGARGPGRKEEREVVGRSPAGRLVYM